MLNIEKYKDEILKEFNDRVKNSDEGRYSEQLANAIFDVFCCDKYKREKENVVEWAFREYKELIQPILTEEEKKIILNIIDAFKSFGGELKCIAKYCCNDEPKEYYLNFSYRNHDDLDTFSFNGDELFVGMEVDKLYTLQELGL